MKIKDEHELINEATQLLIDKDIEKAYELLYRAEVYTDYCVSSLLLITRLSMFLNKLNNIPGHIIALKCKRDSGFFTEEQEIDFLNILREYQKLM